MSLTIQYISDVHCETHADLGEGFCKDLDPTGVDVLVIAGDFATQKVPGLHRELFAVLDKKYQDVIFVPGNHDYWGGRVADGGYLFDLEVEFQSLVVLDSTMPFIQIGDQAFTGSTLWFPQPEPGLEAWAKKHWSDYRHVLDAPQAIFDSNKSTRAYFENLIRKDDVVITHHAPSPKSIHPKYAGDPTNHFYYTDLEKLILEKQPKLWIHGHMHDRFDYTIGETRVVCNPYGYPSEIAKRGLHEPLLITI